jgi:ribonucleoside-diphosphate reductase alpha subunit
MKRTNEIHVINRSGVAEPVRFDKIQNRLDLLSTDLNVSISYLTQGINGLLVNNIKSSEIDILTSTQCSILSVKNPDYGILAGRILVSNHQKNVDGNIEVMFRELNKQGNVDLNIYNFVENNKEELNSMMDHSRDYLITYFGFKTLEKSYLLRDDKDKIIERIQHLWMRVAIGVNKDLNINKIKQTYDLLSLKKYTHATPTLYNACTKTPQLSSCFLLGTGENDDSLIGIYGLLTECALISKYSGGIGLHINNVRATGTRINSTGGKSTGITPMLRVFNETANYVNQGGKRNGSIAVYLEPWHLDVETYLEMRTNQGDARFKARDLFYALWIPDLFMNRVKGGEKWMLFCPHVYPNLSNVYGDKFDELYVTYEKNALEKGDNYGYKYVNALDIWDLILRSQIETGMPYMLYKDAVNKKCNQSNLGTIKSSNLCCEITEYSDSNETSVCNLASISLPSFVKNGVFDYEDFTNTVEVIVENLDNIIDINYYPVEKSRVSNMKNRPIGIGVQGMAEMFFKLNINFDSEEAIQVNRDIFETLYYSALNKSNLLAIERGIYSSFEGSPTSKGLLQYDLWNQTNEVETNSRYNWKELKQRIVSTGLRHSLLVAPMPTASTSQILGNSECFDPIQSNISTRRTLAGEFMVVNDYLIRDLGDKWNEDIEKAIIINGGSVQGIEQIPIELQNKYKTIYEIGGRHSINMAVARAPFICQSQSLNYHCSEPTKKKLTSYHFDGWKKGLKTGMYYLRSKAAHKPQQFTIEVEKECTVCSA